MSVMIRDAAVDGRRCSVLVDHGLIEAVGPIHGMPLADIVVDADGGALIPGLHDHHIHLRSAAVAASSISLDANEVQGTSALRVRLRRAAKSDPDGWIRVVGYHESVAGDLDRHVVDAIISDRPVRIQHRSGSLWILNTLAIQIAGIDGRRHPGIERDDSGRPTGRLWRADELLVGLSSVSTDQFASLGARAASFGITGFTDATPDQSIDSLRHLAELHWQGIIPQRLHLMAPVGIGRVEGEGITIGPVKIMLDDASLPSVDELGHRLAAVRDAGRAVAIHCVTQVQSVVALTALSEVGTITGTRIEHASVLSPHLDRLVFDLGVTVVTQPHFLVTRGDQYLRDVPADEVASLYRGETLRRAGIPVAAGSDAPFGMLDPWAAMSAATERRSASGAQFSLEERFTPQDALRLYLGSAERPGTPRTVTPGSRADLCLLPAPLDECLDALPNVQPVLTMVSGRIVHGP